MNEEIKSLLNKDKDLSIETIGELDGKILATDFFQNTINDVNIFNENSWKNNLGFDTPNFPGFSKNLEGWSPGFYVFAGPSNMGKTAIMLNIAIDLCLCKKNKLFAIYFSLDDSKDKIIARIIAMNELIPINVVSKPNRTKNKILNGDEDSIELNKLLEKREKGIENLKNNSDKITIFDSREINTIDDIYTKTKQIYSYIKAIDEEMNIIIVIDSLKDIELDSSYGKFTANEKIDMVSKKIKDLSVELNCIIFSSMHLRKLNANRRPNMDDLRDSNTLEYELDVCFLVYNDVSKNNQGAKIFYRESEEDTEKKQVLELNWGKNKLSSFKGHSFCNFANEYSKCIECNEESSIRYNALIYEL